MWRVAGLRVRSPSPPHATRSDASRLVFFLWSGAAFHFAGFAIFGDWRAKSIITLGPSGRLATVAIDLFVSPRGSTIQRQLVEQASLVPHTRLARTRRRLRLRVGEEATARSALPRAQTTPRAEAHGRSTVARFSGASFPCASVRSSAFTQPSPARRPRRCAAAQQNLTRGDRRLWRNPV